MRWNRRGSWWLMAGAALAMVGLTGASRAATWEELQKSGAQAKDWINYGGDLGEMRYWPGTTINAGNVHRLHVKWIFQTGVVGSFETTPIVDGDVMYLTTPYDHVFAVDARNGKELWHFQYKLGANYFCCGPNNRGVVVVGDKVLFATLDAHLVALNKKTGDKIWDTEVADSQVGYSLTSAPAIYKNMAIIGIAGGEYGIRGFISAYNIDDGKLVWRWHTIPSPDETNPDGTKGWEGTFHTKADGINDLHRDVAAEKAAIASGKDKDSWMHGGAGNWTTDAIDARRGVIYAAIGNPSPDLDGLDRPGDDRWSDSIVAVDANTGKIKWAYQVLPHDVWDLDEVSPPILAQVKGASGKMVDAVIQAGKTGWVYVLDRDTGKLIRRSETMVPQENLFALPTEKGTRMLPGANGGVEWSPCAFNPGTRLDYCVNLHQPMNYIVKHETWDDYRKRYAQAPNMWLGGAFVAIPDEKQYGIISAVDVDTGKIAWHVNTPQPMIGGALTTKGDLVFAGQGDGTFAAYDAKTGKVLWSFAAGAGVNSAPMAFELGGKPYIAVGAGGNFQLNFKYGDSLIVFGLD
ncbi:MAG TPA: PQQ-binding-like beta-propeller repeat protein [Stellaceae bacterium]|nr:PQQ-binding-like beta-propeller repeat protein [Stellaceae bacterium]